MRLSKTVIGMVHVGALPGTPKNSIPVKLPVIIGSGINTNNIQKYRDFADAFIVGSSLKKEGKWENEVSRERVSEFMKIITELRK